MNDPKRLDKMEKTDPLQIGANTYEPEIWKVKKDVIYFSIPALESGIEYAKEVLARHDSTLGRTVLSNKRAAEGMEEDIRKMEKALKMLKTCKAPSPQEHHEKS